MTMGGKALERLHPVDAQAEAAEEVLQILDLYSRVYTDLLAVPVCKAGPFQPHAARAQLPRAHLLSSGRQLSAAGERCALAAHGPLTMLALRVCGRGSGLAALHQGC